MKKIKKKIPFKNGKIYHSIEEKLEAILIQLQEFDERFNRLENEIKKRKSKKD